MPFPTDQPSIFADETLARVPRRLLDAADLLGPCTPLPALFEEVVRAWRGLPVESARLRTATALREELAADLPALAAAVTDAELPYDVRLLAGTLWALARPAAPGLAWPAGQPRDGDDPAWVPVALAGLTQPDPDGRYATLVDHLLVEEDGLPDTLPTPLLLLGVLKGLCEGTLPPEDFAAAILCGRVLHPAVAAHRPLRRLHRLLDYLGLADDPQVQLTYRQLAADIWPGATMATWPRWRWITRPGGPELLPAALRAITAGTGTLVDLHAVKYAPLPEAAPLDRLLAEAELPAALLLAWLRSEVRPHLGAWQEAVTWLTGSPRAATPEDVTCHPWWPAWLRDGLPAARQALQWLLQMPLPPGAEVERPLWLERHYLPDLRHISANLLRAQAATGEELDEIRALATAGDLAALAALGSVSTPDSATLDLLRAQAHGGNRPQQAVARAALEQIAARQGLSGREDLERRRLLEAAWDLGPLAGERVRVGWEVDHYRLRLSLQHGRATLEVLGPQGPLTRVPAEVRAHPAYQEARTAQRETQQRYTLFKAHLERLMLAGQPITQGEFRYLLTNPIFAHLAERLLWRTADGIDLLWAGPGRWETRDGALVDLTGDGHLTLALVHPVALARDGVLAAWQALAADRRLMQPFKQLFREVYIPHHGDEEACRRFAGRRIEPGRAYALLRAAGFAPGNGTARRDWPAGVTAHLCWAEGATGRDLFGPYRKDEVATGAIHFTRAGEPLPIPLVDPIIFSETLRAADLLTTRAAVGEAELTSQETIALRVALLREMARSFDLTNIIAAEDKLYALVLGTRATYRLNLASGTVLLEPEGRQVVVPTPDPRWRPSEDGDATTEILTLALTLAHDAEITDLTFLAQL